MKSERWRKLLKVNQKMMRHEINKLSKITDLRTHTIRGSYGISHDSVSAYVVPNDNFYTE